MCVRIKTMKKNEQKRKIIGKKEKKELRKEQEDRL